MKAWMKAVLCISLSFMCMFTCVGYALTSDNLNIRGKVKVDIPYGLFIINVSTKSMTNVDTNRCSVGYLPHSTTVKSTVNRKTYNSVSSVTYTVTVLNNTKLTYSYRDIYYQTNLSDYAANNSISDRTGDRNVVVVCELKDAPAEDKKVIPGDTLEFDVTYNFGKKMDTSGDLKTLINFQFGINVDGEREALEVIEDKFLNILNTTSTYEQLIDSLDNKFDGSQEWTSNYIGNVKGSSSDDSVAVNTLFAGQLQITVGDDEMDATVLIKHENLDGNTQTGDDYVAKNQNNGGVFRGYGCEMTLYLTIDTLSSAGKYVPVYVVVFTCDRDENGNIGDWYRIGTTYAGTANVVTYEGGNGTGSFVTDNWIADAATYKLIDGYSFNINGTSYNLNSYSHNIAQRETIKNIVTAKDVNAINTLQTLLNDAKRIIDNKDYAGVGIDLIEEALEEILVKFANYYTIDENGNYVVDSNLTIAQVSPAILNLYDVVNDALIRIDTIAKQQ